MARDQDDHPRGISARFWVQAGLLGLWLWVLGYNNGFMRTMRKFLSGKAKKGRNHRNNTETESDQNVEACPVITP